MIVKALVITVVAVARDAAYDTATVETVPVRMTVTVESVNNTMVSRGRSLRAWLDTKLYSHCIGTEHSIRTENILPS